MYRCIYLHLGSLWGKCIGKTAIHWVDLGLGLKHDGFVGSFVGIRENKTGLIKKTIAHHEATLWLKWTSLFYVGKSMAVKLKIKSINMLTASIISPEQIKVNERWTSPSQSQNFKNRNNIYNKTPSNPSMCSPWVPKYQTIWTTWNPPKKTSFKTTPIMGCPRFGWFSWVTPPKKNGFFRPRCIILSVLLVSRFVPNESDWSTQLLVVAWESEGPSEQPPPKKHEQRNSGTLHSVKCLDVPRS